MADLHQELLHWRSISLPSARAVCHAWTKDLSMLAYCDGSPAVQIFSISIQNPGKCDLRHMTTLKEHNQRLSAMQWASSGLLVTCSHDRTSYVWHQDSNTGDWTQQLVIMKLQRAALCVEWSPCESKFAIGSGTKNVCVCTFEKDNNWWAGRLIRKAHDSSVCCVAWHSDDMCLATGSTDGHCRVFYANVNADQNQQRKFGELLFCIDLCCWVNSLAWSPNGSTLVAAGHDRCIHLLQLPKDPDCRTGSTSTDSIRSSSSLFNAKITQPLGSSDQRTTQKLTSSSEGLGSDSACPPGFRTKLHVTTSLCTGGPVTYMQLSEGGVQLVLPLGWKERPRHANLTNYPHSSACHSMILFPDGHSVTSQRIKLPSLPAQAVVHIDAGHVIAAGWDGVIYTIRTVTATESLRLDGDSACLLSAKGRSLADQCQSQCVSMLGRNVCFLDEAPTHAVQDEPFHTACVQELELLQIGTTSIVSSLDRKGQLHLWRWE